MMIFVKIYCDEKSSFWGKFTILIKIYLCQKLYHFDEGLFCPSPHCISGFFCPRRAFAQVDYCPSDFLPKWHLCPSGVIQKKRKIIILWQFSLLTQLNFISNFPPMLTSACLYNFNHSCLRTTLASLIETGSSFPF